MYKDYLFLRNFKDYYDSESDDSEYDFEELDEDSPEDPDFED